MYFLGIDNGSTIAKAGIYDETGREIAVSSCKAEITSPEEGWYERNLDHLWDSNVRAIREALKKSGLTGSDISGISLTGHGNGLILTDGEGVPLHPAIEGADGRAQEFVDTWNSDGTFQKIHPKTLQCLWAAQPPALLAWFRKYRPEILEKAKYVFMIKDYLRFKLSGTAAAELSDMSATSIFNVHDGCYDDELFDILGLSDCRRLFPDIVGSTEICGTLSFESAALTGLTEGTPVAGGAFDIDAAALATGVIDESRMNVIAGTWCNNQYVSSVPVVSEDLFMVSLFADQKQWLVLEGSATSASNLEWFVSEFMEEERKAADASGKSVYQICDEEVASLGPGESDIVFVPFLYGSNASLKAKSVFLGLQGFHKRAHIIRAIFEGVVFSHRHHIEKLMEFRKLPDAARMAGGAVNSEVWTQMFADILGFPMEITHGRELGCLGAAICAAVGTGVYGTIPEAVDGMVTLKKRVEPDPALKDIYDKKYARYKKAIGVLEEYWD
jgi:L-xylulokinase